MKLRPFLAVSALAHIAGIVALVGMGHIDLGRLMPEAQAQAPAMQQQPSECSAQMAYVLGLLHMRRQGLTDEQIIADDAAGYQAGRRAALDWGNCKDDPVFSRYLAFAPETACLTYGKVTLTGTVRRVHGIDMLYGREIPKTYYILDLPTPICVMANADEPAERNVQHVQIWDADPSLSGRVTITANLWHSFTTHHQTAVLIDGR